MKKIIVIHFLLICLIGLALFSITSCGNTEPKKSYTEQLFEGKHELRKFNVTTETGERWSGSYFLIGGGASGSTYSNTKITFAWKLHSGEYALSELERSKIRVRIDSTIKKPYITFRWSKPRGNEEKTLEYLMSGYVNYIVVHCREEDFPTEVNIKELN